MLSSKVLVGVVILIVLSVLGILAVRGFKDSNRMAAKDNATYTNGATGKGVSSSSSAPAPSGVTLLLSDKQTPLSQEEVEYFPGAKGLYVRPAAELDREGDYPGVVMIHENRGLRPEIRQMAQELAKEGYQVLAVDLYHGQTVEDQTQARALSQGFNQDEGTKNLQAAAQYLKQKGATKLASLGWCFGGKQSLMLSVSGTLLNATVVYYGGGMPTKVEELKPINWPVLGIFGDRDQVIPLSQVQEFEQSLKSLGVKNEIHIYPGVGHAFANPSGANYAPEATKDAWAKTLNFLNSNLKST